MYRYLSFLFFLIGINSCTSSSSEPVLPQSELIQYIDYKKPDSKKKWGNYSVDILYTGEITYSKLYDVALLFDFAFPERVVVRVWSSTSAYHKNRRQVFDQEFKSGFLIYYSKNVSNDYNAIKWMQ